MDALVRRVQLIVEPGKRLDVRGHAGLGLKCDQHRANLGGQDGGDDLGQA
jgi:hypothetical protein